MRAVKVKLPALALAGLSSFTAQAGYNVSDYFHPMGPSESLVAKFDHSAEATTSRRYHGFILVEISGGGWAMPAVFRGYDAFYLFANRNFPWAPWIPSPDPESLHIAFDGDTAVLGQSYYVGADTDPDPTKSLFQIIFNESAGVTYGECNSAALPLYETNHVYSIVLFINSTEPRIVNFGFGGSGGNGEYDVTITPVRLREDIGHGHN